MDEFEKELNEQQDLTPDTPDVPAEAAEPEVPAEAAEPEVPADDAQDDAAFTPSPTGEDALVEELEGIRDLLQRELDNAQNGEGDETGEAAETGDADDADAAEGETEEEAPEDIPEEERCLCCGERRRDTSFGEDYPYCSDCRALMKAAPFKLTSVLGVLVVFVVTLVSLVLCAGNVQDYATLMEAETYYANRRIMDAYTSYQGYVSSVSEFDSYSRSAVRNLTTIFADMGFIGDANELITRFYTEDQLKLPWNKRFASVKKDFDQLSASSEKLSEVMQDVMYPEGEIDYEKKSAQLDKLGEPAEDGTPGLPEIYVEYYRFVLMNKCEKSDEEQMEQLKKVESLDDGNHISMYISSMLSLAAKTGDIETTRSYFDRCMKINVQEDTAYTAMANAYRFSENPDPDKILEVVAQAEENMAGSGVPSYLVSRAIAELLKDDAESAMKTMEDYMNSGSSTGQAPYTVQSCNLYALCAVVTGDEEVYKQMEDVLASADMKVSDLVVKYRDGKLTLEEVLTDNGGDI